MGRYVEFSWDVMEPISYFLGLTNAIFAYSYFLYTRGNWEYASMYGHLFSSVQV